MEFQNGAVCLQSCIKPQHQEVKLELALDVHSSNYDTSRGEQIACNVDGVAGSKNEKKAEEKFFKKLVVLLSYIDIHLFCIVLRSLYLEFVQI
jgi:hypothetical protein